MTLLRRLTRRVPTHVHVYHFTRASSPFSNPFPSFQFFFDAMAAAKETLKKIEQMLVDLGGSNQVSVVEQHGASSHRSASRAALVAHATSGKDCLAADSRSQLQLYSLKRGNRKADSPDSLPSPGATKGVHMAGKDRAEKRYYGTGFNLPSAESPGPIYAPSPGFADDVSQNRIAGCSFSRAPRNQGDRTSSCTPGPNIYSLPASVGRQPQSDNSNASSAVFSRAGRFNSKEFISRIHSKNSASTDSPAPGTYDPPTSAFRDGTSVPFTGSLCKKQFISAGHVVDSLGEASPGPAYSIDSASKMTSKYRTAPKFKFGGGAIGDRIVDVVNEDGTVERVVRPRVQPFISHAHSKVMSNSDTPGPAAYSPSDEATQPRTKSAVFVKDRAEKKRFFSRELSTQIGLTSPGPIYVVNDQSTERHTASAVFAPVKSVPPSDRFAGKVFLGPNMGTGSTVSVSPGPIYDLPPPEKGPSYSIVAKERAPTKGVFPGPTRSRYISQELASENLGAYGPGPKYDIRGDISKEGPKFTFGVSDRYFGDNLTEAHRAKFGTAEHPYTSPGEARFVSHIFSRIAMAGKTSPGPQNPNCNPSDDTCSNRHRVKTPKMSPPVSPTRARPADDATAGDPPRLLYPKYEFGKPASTVVSIPHASRRLGEDAASGAATGGHGGGKRSGEHSGTGPSYHVKFDQVDPAVPGVRFGGLF